jgi:hypothetical protein
MTKPVNTAIGEIPESDLEFKTLEQDCGDTIIMSRDWTYKGADPAFADHVGQVVRRDCWVTMKCGITTAGAAEL